MSYLQLLFLLFIIIFYITHFRAPSVAFLKPKEKEKKVSAEEPPAENKKKKKENYEVKKEVTDA
jgi:hypothetical protein